MNFELREWRREDAESIAKYANNKHIADNVRNIFPHPYTLADAQWYINNCIHSDKKRQFLRAIEINGEAAGSIGLTLQEDIHCKCAELGYWLGEPFWNRGIISAAIKQICETAFKEYDLARIYAEAFAHNLGSRKALTKAGFHLEGILQMSVYKNGQIYDSCMYALTSNDQF